jgi:isocitrate dehydrogenase (NAD+)
MPTPVTLISGDGIGPSISSATVRLLEAAGADISWDAQYAGMAGVARYGDPIPDETLDSIKRTRVALKGPLETPIGEGFRSINVSLRKTFELYANVRPAHTIRPGGRYENIDLVLIRENTEGLYIGNEHYIKIGSDPRAAAESIALITRAGSERIVRYAFDYARNHGRHKVTFCHKADVMRMSDGLFLKCATEVADEFPFIEFDQKPIDNVCLELVLDPTKFDVLVMENLFGDVISDLCAGLVGGLGVVPGANLGQRYAVFEAVHGSAPDIAGKGLANPVACLRSAAMMLDHVGAREAALRIEHSVRKTLEKRVGLTKDLGGDGNTESITRELIANLAA